MQNGVDLAAQKPSLGHPFLHASGAVPKSKLDRVPNQARYFLARVFAKRYANQGDAENIATIPALCCAKSQSDWDHVADSAPIQKTKWDDL